MSRIFYRVSCCGTQVFCIHQISGELNPAALNGAKSNKNKAILPSINTFTESIVIYKLNLPKLRFRKETFINIKTHKLCPG